MFLISTLSASGQLFALDKGESAIARPFNPEGSAVPSDDGEYSLDLHKYHGSSALYKKTIIDLEDTYGVYDNRLVEQLVGLGLSEKAQGAGVEAIAAFKRALHIKRVNSGLYSLAQVPILSHLIDSYVAVEDWKSANDKQSLIYNIQQQHYGEDNPKLLVPINNMVKWHLIAFNRGSSMRHLLRAIDLNKKAIAIIEKNYGVHDPRLNETLYRHALASFHLSEQQTLSQPASFGQPTGVAQTPGRTYAAPETLPTYFNPYRDGKRALLRRVNLFKSNPELPINDQVEALVHLGDWYFLFDKRESALKVYTEALRLLSGTDQDNLAGRIFDRPRALNFAISFDDASTRLDKKKQTGYVRIKFSVTPSGRTRDIEIVESNPPDMKDSEVYKSIKSTRYRPRIVDGRPVLAKGVIEKHIFDI